MPLSSILIRNWPQFAKILLLTILILVFSFGWVWFREIPRLHNDLIRERTKATQYPVQIVVSLLDAYRDRVIDGELTLHEAQAKALQVLQKTRYADNQYFWIHDLSQNMLMHPFATELVGENLADFRDSRGNYIFREMNELVRVKSEAIIEYTWPRPGRQAYENKMSCIRLYEPWGWVIGSGVYLDDVTADISSIKQRVLSTVITVFMFAVILSLYIIYRISQPLQQAIAFARQIAGGQAIDSISINPETEGGKVVAVMKGLMSDLHAAYRRQKSIIETTSDGFFILDADGRFIEVNRSFALMIGYSRDELLSVRLEAVEVHMSEDSKKYHIAELTEKKAACLEKQYCRKDGTLVDVEVSVNYTEEDNGCLIFFIRDISKRIRMRREELQAAILKNAMLENSPLGIAYIKDQQLNWVNSQLAAMLAVSEEEVVGQPLQKIFPDENEFEKFVNDSAEAMVLHGIHACELQLIRMNGSSWWCRLSGSRLELNTGESGVIWLFEDISDAKRLQTERELLEAQLIQSQKMDAIGKLAGGVAHEFNNILQVIGGYTTLLNEICDSLEHKDYLTTIDSSVKRASRLTQGMLTYSRQQIFSLSVLDIDEAVRQILPFLDATLGENIKLEVISSPEPLYCNIDTHNIQQAVVNLVTNARDAIGHSGTITITSGHMKVDQEFVRSHTEGKQGIFAVISVSDTGEGMDDATRARIFDPFYTTKDIGKGTGLGLSIVFGIMSQHNGFVTCDTAPGKGSTFSLFLPLDDSENTNVSTARILHPANRKSGGTVLLAEDDAGAGKVITKMLELSGFKVLLARDGNEAVETFMSFGTSIDLLLFDVMMPNKNSKEALNEIRAINPDIPVCFMSGYASEILDLDFSQNSVNAFIAKPVDHIQLISTLDRLLSSDEQTALCMT